MINSEQWSLSNSCNTDYKQSSTALLGKQGKHDTCRIEKSFIFQLYRDNNTLFFSESFSQEDDIVIKHPPLKNCKNIFHFPFTIL